MSRRNTFRRDLSHFEADARRVRDFCAVNSRMASKLADLLVKAYNSGNVFLYEEFNRNLSGWEDTLESDEFARYQF